MLGTLDKSSDKRVLVAITSKEARIWTDGLEKGAEPVIVESPAEKDSVGHLRQTQHQSGHAEDPVDWGYFDFIADEVRDASEILIIGHGDGSGSAAQRFEKFVEEHDQEVAKKIVGNLDENLMAMSENLILAIGREWFDNFHRHGLPL